MFVISADLKRDFGKDCLDFTHEFNREGENRTMFTWVDQKNNMTFISVDWIQNGKLPAVLF